MTKKTKRKASQKRQRSNLVIFSRIQQKLSKVKYLLPQNDKVYDLVRIYEEIKNGEDVNKPGEMA